MSNIFVDSNVVIYVMSDDKRKYRAASVLTLQPLISVQVVNETINVLRVKQRLDWDVVAGAIDRIRRLCPIILPIDDATQRVALTLARRYRLRIYDAQICASALQSGCSTLYSEELQHGQRIDDRLTILNPFA